MKSITQDIQGIKMRWEEDGEGHPVVYVHGIPTSPRLWRYVSPLVPGRSMAWEMIGYGRSIPQGRYREISVSCQAEYLAAWIFKNHFDRSILVGHDIGGAVVQLLAVRYPELVGGIVLVNPACYDAWPVRSIRRLRKIKSILERMPDSLIYSIVKSLICRGHTNKLIAHESLDQHWLFYEASANAAQAFVRQIESLNNRDTLNITSQLAHIDVPCRILWGREDPFQDVSYGRRLARALNTSVNEVPKSRHYIPEDYPGHVATAILEVISRIQVPVSAVYQSK